METVVKNSRDIIGNWLDNNPNAFGEILALTFTTMGVLMIIGAIKDWDWLYAPDGEYHHKWTMGQISRYLGRRTARIWGAIVGGFILLPLGVMMIYGTFFKSY